MSTLTLGFDLNEALAREQISPNIMSEIRKAKVPGMPDSITDQQLVLFYCACEKDLEDTKVTIQNYFEHKRNTPEHFANRDPSSDKIKQCLNNQIYFYLPVTPNGHSVVYHRLANSKPSNYVFDEAIKTFFMLIDSCLYTHGPRPGVIFLFDMKNVNLGHLTRISIRSIKKFFHFVQECLPAKLAEIHILNTVGFFDKVLGLIKPFMKGDVMQRLHMHPSTTDYEALLKDIIPLSCLPSDFEGAQPSVNEMNETHLKEFQRLRQYFIEEVEQWNSKDTKPAVIEETRRQFSGLDID